MPLKKQSMAASSHSAVNIFHNVKPINQSLSFISHHNDQELNLLLCLAVLLSSQIKSIISRASCSEENAVNQTSTSSLTVA